MNRPKKLDSVTVKLHNILNKKTGDVFIRNVLVEPIPPDCVDLDAQCPEIQTDDSGPHRCQLNGGHKGSCKFDAHLSQLHDHEDVVRAAWRSIHPDDVKQCGATQGPYRCQLPERHLGAHMPSEQSVLVTYLHGSWSPAVYTDKPQPLRKLAVPLAGMNAEELVRMVNQFMIAGQRRELRIYRLGDVWRITGYVGDFKTPAAAMATWYRDGTGK